MVTPPAGAAERLTPIRIKHAYLHRRWLYLNGFTFIAIKAEGFNKSPACTGRSEWD
jgi:hypothetical protein